MPEPELPDEGTKMLSDEGEALKLMISYLEDWSLRQQAILKDTLNKIVIAKGALPRAYASNLSNRTTASVSARGNQNRVELPSEQEENILQESEPPQDESGRLSFAAEAKIQNAVSRASTRTSLPPERSFYFKMIAKVEDYVVATATSLLAKSHPPSGWLARAVRSRVFEMLFVAVILTNLLILILSTDNQIENALQGDSNDEDTYFAFDAAFTCAYTLELACRLYANRLRFVLTVDWRWNLLDTFLTIVAIQDTVIVASGSLTSKTNFNFLRLIRLLKLLKTLRLLRVLRAFRDLRIMLNSIVGSIYVMGYAFVLIVVVMFGFGIFLSQGTGIYLSESPHGPSADLLIYYWGSVTTSMASLYMAVLGGENWRTMADSLIVVGDGFRLAFFAFVAFFLLVIVNTITSVFVESAIQLGEKDSASQIKEEIEKKTRYVRQLKDLFKRMDRNKDGLVDFDELVASLETEEMVGFMSKLMIDVHDAKQFLEEMMSVQGNSQIDLDLFVTKCLKIRGPARSIDLIGLASSQQNANAAIFTELSALRSRAEVMEQILSTSYLYI